MIAITLISLSLTSLSLTSFSLLVTSQLAPRRSTLATCVASRSVCGRRHSQ